MDRDDALAEAQRPKRFAALEAGLPVPAPAMRSVADIRRDEALLAQPDVERFAPAEGEPWSELAKERAPMLDPEFDMQTGRQPRARHRRVRAAEQERADRHARWVLEAMEAGVDDGVGHGRHSAEHCPAAEPTQPGLIRPSGSSGSRARASTPSVPRHRKDGRQAGSGCPPDTIPERDHVERELTGRRLSRAQRGLSRSRENS